MTEALLAGFRLGPIHLTSRDTNRSIPFYRHRLGLELLAEEGDASWLGAGGEPLVVIHEDTSAPPKPAGATGLYHFALLLPDRGALGWALKSLLEADYPLQGAADHLVSEAVYLPDPEGNGIELYRDRPMSEWRFEGGQLQMATEPLDMHAVLAAGAHEEGPAVPAASTVGHVHLQVGDLEAAERFYGAVLGFERTTRYGSQASFYSVGGYHHHIGLNTWAGLGAPPPPEGAVGLRQFIGVLEKPSELGELADRLKVEDIEHAHGPGWIEAKDPSGNPIRFELEANQELPKGS